MTTLLLLFFFSSFSFSETTLQPTSLARSLFSVVSRSSGLLLIALRPKDPHEEILREYREENRKNLTPTPSPQFGEGYQDKRNVDSSMIKRRQAPATPKTEWGARAGAWSGSADRDPNRIHLTDPLVMDFIKNMTSGNKTIKIGDIGCGDGYLALKIHETYPGCLAAIDCCAMIQVAQTKNLQTPSIDYLEDSASRLDCLGENYLDAALYNFVLQDCERLPECTEQLGRVLKPNGKAIIVIPHPAFRSGEKYLELHTQEVHELLGIQYDPPIHVFSRPLAVYVSEFMKSGFVVEKIIEPRLSEEQKKTLNEIDLRQLDTPNPIS
ncbi:MAG: class I SAM-dependent methyltransferase, partial [Myxococcaceae bacterium]